MCGRGYTNGNTSSGWASNTAIAGRTGDGSGAASLLPDSVIARLTGQASADSEELPLSASTRLAVRVECETRSTRRVAPSGFAATILARGMRSRTSVGPRPGRGVSRTRRVAPFPGTVLIQSAGTRRVKEARRSAPDQLATVAPPPCLPTRRPLRRLGSVRFRHQRQGPLRWLCGSPGFQHEQAVT